MFKASGEEVLAVRLAEPILGRDWVAVKELKLRDYPPIMENQMENEMETGGNIGFKLSSLTATQETSSAKFSVCAGTRGLDSDCCFQTARSCRTRLR